RGLLAPDYDQHHGAGTGGGKLRRRCLPVRVRSSRSRRDDGLQARRADQSVPLGRHPWSGRLARRRACPGPGAAQAEGAALMDILLRASIMFAVVFALLRLMGKRELAQMTPFELVLLVV